jgi:hypothetical protein
MGGHTDEERSVADLAPRVLERQIVLPQMHRVSPCFERRGEVVVHHKERPALVAEPPYPARRLHHILSRCALEPHLHHMCRGQESPRQGGIVSIQHRVEAAQFPSPVHQLSSPAVWPRLPRKSVSSG